jgi:type II secretory pathway predicted ATPase ExeA
MPSLSQSALLFLVKLLKHQAKQRLGDGALTVLTNALADYAGETLTEKLTAFLADGQNAEKLLSAFRHADECFSRLNHEYAGVIASQPLAALERLEKLAARFAADLDSPSLLAGIQAQLQSDWGTAFPPEFYPQAARDYRNCLERALAAATGDLLPSIFAKVERIEGLTHEIKNDTAALRSGQEQILAALQREHRSDKAVAAEPSLLPGSPNPFQPLSGRITDPARVFDRSQELRRALDFLRSGSSVALIGESGMGKSSLLTALGARVPADLGWEAVALDLQPLQNEDDFYAALCAALGVPDARGYRLQRALQERGRRSLLILDEIEKMTWEGFSRNLRAALRGLAEGSDAPLKLALAARTPLDRLFPDSEGNTSPLAGICLQIDLRPWNAETARAYLDDRLKAGGARFTPEEIERLLQTSGGHPARLTRLAFDLYARKQEPRP